MTAPELYFHLKKTLDKNGIPSPQFEAMCIAEHIFGKRLPEIMLERQEASEEQINFCNSILYKRISGEPLQYLLGKWEFYGFPFYVGEGVLIPRQDTEILIEKVLSLGLEGAPKIADLCSGSGCIGITLCKKIPHADVTAVEISERAAGYINKNNRLNETFMRLVTGDVLNPKTAAMFKDLDLIVCNPPYLTKEDMENLQTEVKHEPQQALFGGIDGLDMYRGITPLWKDALKPGGYIIFEAGAGQAESVRKILSENGFKNTEITKDLCGIERVISGQLL